MTRIKYIFILAMFLASFPMFAWEGMDMPELHVEGRYLVDEAGNKVNLHGFGQTYSPWFNEQGSKWSNYNVEACLKYNKEKIDKIMKAGWKVNYLRLHMDPYWSNTPGVATTGENDISAFDFNRFKTYLDKVFIPMAEYAISKGLYVVMRAPGVCPEQIEVGGDYHKYLKRVWGYVSILNKLTSNPHIMFELANEPVQIKGTDGNYGAGTDACNESLTQFFQEIVDLMRNNGCNNILWVPGTGYQSQYAGFAKYPIKGENIGYAVHVYPGWYGSDAIEPSHELGGSYGGGFTTFAEGWAKQIEPAAAIAPIMVTEMDWAPSVYNASWGKSITGRMLGEGFGANFKLLADNTGNVSWMIFTGPELLAEFKDEPGTEGAYTFLTDPDACPWPVYHWFKEYAGDELPEVKDIDLYMSPRKDSAVGDSMIMLPGSRCAAVMIGNNGAGYELNISGNVEVSIDDEAVVEWRDGYFHANGIGETDCTLSYAYGNDSGTRNIHFVCTPFPLVSGYFNPSIWEKGNFNESTSEVTTGTYGFAGWQYPSGIDLSGYDYIVAELAAPSSRGVSFRVFDKDSYWTDPAMADFGGDTKVVVNLKEMVSNEGRRLDASHVYIVGFWSLGNEPFRLKRVYVTNDPDGDSGVDILSEERSSTVDVYDLHGRKLKSRVGIEDATDGLLPGIYIVGGKKIKI